MNRQLDTVTIGMENEGKFSTLCQFYGSPSPNTPTVFPDLTHSVKGHVMKPAFSVYNRKCSRSIRQEFNRLKGNRDDPVLHPVKITQLKLPARKFFVPANSIQ